MHAPLLITIIAHWLHQTLLHNTSAGPDCRLHDGALKLHLVVPANALV